MGDTLSPSVILLCWPLFFLDWLCSGCSSSLIWQVKIHSTFAQTMEELSTEDLEFVECGPLFLIWTLLYLRVCRKGFS